MYTPNNDHATLLCVLAAANVRTRTETTALRSIFAELSRGNYRNKPAVELPLVEQTKKAFDATVKGW
jgi:hypothetical protein